MTTAVTATVPVAALAKTAAAAEEGTSPYGELADRDQSGVLLPAGFNAKIVAMSGQAVPGTDFVWRADPDGAATFGDGAGGWYHAVNHETNNGRGGVSTLHFDSDGVVVNAYSILAGTHRNCAGGPTPWGTWLSCEEVANGLVYECTPGQPSQGVVRSALGVFNHEAAAVDPVRRRLYLTEDRGDGLLYRFTPAAYPDLNVGVLEAANVVDGIVDWVEIPDPSAASGDTRYQLPDRTTPFVGGEGIWYHRDRVYFTTKGDNGVWDLHVGTGKLTRIWSGSSRDPSADQLTGVDNISVENGSGDLFVAEDGGNMELVLITAQGSVAPFLRVTGHSGSEITGPCFNPQGDRLFFSSQRGSAGAGVTYMVTGPFRGGPSVVTSTPEPTVEPTVEPSATPELAVEPSATPELTAVPEPTVEPTPTGGPGAATPSATPSAVPSSTSAPAGTVEAEEPAAAAGPAPTPTASTSAAASSAESVPLDPDTPDPSATLVASTAEADDATTNAVAVGAGALIAAAAGATLIKLRRRQDAAVKS